MGNSTNPCKTPGMKIRSKGKGRGLARGQGKGPMGVPFFSKGSNPLARFGGLISPLKK